MTVGETNDCGIDIPESIQVALSKNREREYLLFLEKELIKFIRHQINSGSRDILFTIEATYLINSYYRLLSHQLCQYYHLQHWNNKSNEIIASPIKKVDYNMVLKSFESGRKLSDQIRGRVKPRMLRKKAADLSDDRHDANNTSRTHSSSTSGQGSLQISETSASTSPVVESDPTMVSTKIESERASKEAIYMKIREEVFKMTNESEPDESSDDQGNSVEEVQSHMPLIQMLGMPHPMIHNVYPSMSPVVPPGMQPFGMPPAFPQVTPSLQPMLNTQAPFYGPPIYPIPTYMPPLPYYEYPAPVYDKGIERKLLNNPFIILPEDQNSKSKHRKYQRHPKAPHTH
ncbi:uncharacterized protein PRCAT00005373001 [Priceomyces carsonii]|uniref:uncharacterized protein n=1 Tax=Priceomyces carsonii TaxID=28549 RepID=UPI002ED951FC|nr:unnamed protein product [Priceomyces carsonii]